MEDILLAGKGGNEGVDRCKFGRALSSLRKIHRFTRNDEWTAGREGEAEKKRGDQG